MHDDFRDFSWSKLSLYCSHQLYLNICQFHVSSIYQIFLLPMPRKRKRSFASPFDGMEWENEKLSYVISAIQVQRRGQLFLVWKVRFHVKFFDKPEHIWDKKKENMILQPLHTAIMLGLHYLDSSGKPNQSGKKIHLHIFLKWCFRLNCFLFNLVYASSVALGEAAWLLSSIIFSWAGSLYVFCYHGAAGVPALCGQSFCMHVIILKTNRDFNSVETVASLLNSSLGTLK